MNSYPDLPILQTAQVVLASGSPRRREIVGRLLAAESFLVRPANIDESQRDGESPTDYVSRLSREKADAAAHNFVDSDEFKGGEVLIIAADTIVTLDGKVHGKPTDNADAARILGELSDRTHQVTTSTTLLKFSGNFQSPHYVDYRMASDVTFRALSAAEIEWYVQTGEATDKAGAYAIQGYGGAFINSVRGDYYNIVGLPFSELIQKLRTL